MKKIILSLLMTAAISGYSQNPSLQWVEKVNGQASGIDVTNASWKDPNGNYYLTGTSNGNAVVLKVDANGNQLAQFTYDGPQHGNDVGKAIKADANGNIYVGGITQYNSFNTPFLVKFNSSGVKQWEYFQPNLTMDGDLTAIALDAFTNPTNVYFVGSKNDSSVASRINIVTGTRVWEYMNYPHGKYNDIDIDTYGHPIVCGYQAFSGNNPDLYVAELDINTGYHLRGFYDDGSVADSVDHTPNAVQHFDMAAKIKAGPAGSFVVLGTVYDNVSSATVMVYKFGSTSSTPVWAYSYDAPTHTEGVGVQLVADASFNNFYFLARANSTGGAFTTYPIIGKLNSAGNNVWEKEYTQGLTSFDPQDMAIDGNSNVHLVANVPTNGGDIYYLKLGSASGSIISFLDYDNQRNGSNAKDLATSIFIDNTSHPYFFGSSDAGTYTQSDVLMVTLNTNSTLNWDLVFDYFITTPNNVTNMIVCLAGGSGGDQIVTCGNVYNSVTNQDASVTSYSEAGNVLWHVDYDNANANDEVVGFDYDAAENSFFLCTVNSALHIISVVEFYSDGTTNGTGVQPTFNFNVPQQFKTDTIGNCFITGNGLNTDDYLLGTINRSNSAVSSNTASAAMGNNAYPSSLVGDNLSNIYVGGVHERGAFSAKYLMVEKFDLNANKIWSTSIIGLDSSNTSTSLAKIVYDKASASIYITGTVGIIGNSQLFTVLAKLDLNGNIIWVKKYNKNSTRSESPKNLAVINGKIYVAGNATDVSNPSDNYVFVEKWDINGNYLWNQSYNSSIPNADDGANGITADPVSENLFIAGYSDGLQNTGYNMLTLKLDSAGNMIWAKEYSSTTGVNKAMGVTLSKKLQYINNPRVYVFGNAQGAQGPNLEIATLKYCDLPAAHVTHPASTNICANSSLVLGSSGGALSNSLVWNTGGQTTSSITVNTTGNYYFTSSDPDGCSENSDTITVNLKSPPPAVQICMVTVDSLSTHNIIYWDKTGVTGDVVGFKMYREDLTNIYTYIGSVSIDSISEYHDYGVNPNVTTKRYKISAVDSCGNESAQSNYHNTIYIVNVGGGQYIWNPIYTIENSPNPVSSYVLMRDDNNTGNFQQIASTAGNQNTLTDPNYASYPNANWRVDALGFNCNPTLRLASGNNGTLAAKVKSHSNQNNNRQVGINQISGNNAQLTVYPNPSTGNITVSNSQKIDELRVSDVLGNVVYETKLADTKTTLHIENSGVYFITVISGKETTIRKVVVND